MHYSQSVNTADINSPARSSIIPNIAQVPQLTADKIWDNNMEGWRTPLCCVALRCRDNDKYFNLCRSSGSKLNFLKHISCLQKSDLKAVQSKNKLIWWKLAYSSNLPTPYVRRMIRILNILLTSDCLLFFLCVNVLLVKSVYSNSVTLLWTIHRPLLDILT